MDGKRSGRAMTISGGLALGGMVSLLITLFGVAVLAKLVERECVPQSNIGYGIMVVLVLASYLGATVSFVKVKHRKILVCTCSGAIYIGLLMGMTALFFGGQYRAVWVTVLLVVCGTGLAMLTGKTKSGRKRRRVRLYAR